MSPTEASLAVAREWLQERRHANDSVIGCVTIHDERSLAIILDAAEARGRAKGPEWQGIARAPKDGTVILGAYYNDIEWEYRLVAWSRRYKKYPWAQADGTNYWAVDRVTHWMPIPAGP